MNQTMSNTPLRDAMYAMSLAKPIPDAELLDEFVRRYPEHAEALTDFAIELAVDALMHGDDDEEAEVPVDMEAINPAVSRVMSQFQNRLFEMAQKRAVEPPARAATASVANPFADLDRGGFRALASRLDINSAFLSKLRDRMIEPTTIPNGYCRHVAQEMDEDFEALTAHLYAPPEVAHARQYYKSEGKPGIGTRQSFEEAVRDSGLTEEQQRRLLSFRG
jgi:hypothetical protein